MSWHCSQALVGEFWEATCLAGAPSAPLSSTPTPAAFYFPDKTTEHSRLSRFGMTSEPLTADIGEELLMWFRAAFHARTSALPEKAMDSTESEADSGQKWRGWFAKFDPDSCSWKTAQCSFLEDSTEFSETWPQWGLMRGGACWEQTMSALPTVESESGFWATPTTMDSLPPKSAQALHREATVVRPGRSKPANLRDQVSNSHMWPTPTTQANVQIRGEGKAAANPKRGTTLAGAVHMWPSPTARDWKDTPGMTMSLPDRTRTDQLARKVFSVEQTPSGGGTLNPDWTEWLMGWPIGWTDLKPLATVRFQQWQQQHGESLVVSEEAREAA